MGDVSHSGAERFTGDGRTKEQIAADHDDAIAVYEGHLIVDGEVDLEEVVVADNLFPYPAFRHRVEAQTAPTPSRPVRRSGESTVFLRHDRDEISPEHILSLRHRRRLIAEAEQTLEPGRNVIALESRRHAPQSG